METGLTIRVYTPASDYTFGAGGQFQTIWGRSGNDTIIGYNPQEGNETFSQIDLIITDLDEAGPNRVWSNILKFGDAIQPYYLDNADSGFQRFAFILDFEKENDIIKYYGTSDNYQLVRSAFGTGVFYVDEEGQQDLVTFLFNRRNLSLDDDYFVYEQDNLVAPVNTDIQQFGTNSIDQSQSVATDSAGNVYLAGSTGGDLFGSNNAGGGRDFWIAKYNSQGQLLNQKVFGTDGFDQINEIVITPEGDIFWSGITTGDFAGPNEGDRDIVVARYDNNFNEIWKRQYGNTSIDLSNDLAVDSENNTYVVGIEAVGIKQDDTTVVKFDANGNQLWETYIGNTLSYDESYQMTLGPDGSVYVAGWTFGDLTNSDNAEPLESDGPLGIGSGSGGLYDVWFAKLNPESGEVEWLKQIQGDRAADQDFPWGIVTDSQGNIYMAGWTAGNLGGPNAGSFDVWLLKTDSEGNEIYSTQFGTAGDDGVFKDALHIDENDNLYITGYTDNSLSGNSAGGFDAWVRKVNTDNGQPIWQKQFGTNSGEYPYDLVTDPSGQSLYLTGLTEGALGSTNKGSTDIWALKLNANSGAFESFNPNPEPNQALGSATPSGLPQVPEDVMSQRLDSLIENLLNEQGHLLRTPPEGFGVPFV